MEVLELSDIEGTDAAVQLLEVAGWDARIAGKILEVQGRIPSVPLRIAREVLVRNDDHAGAATEMLRDFRDRAAAHVTHRSPFSGKDATAIADYALESCEWNPWDAFRNAEYVWTAVRDVRVGLQRCGSPNAPVDLILPFLTGEHSPRAGATLDLKAVVNAILGRPTEGLHARPTVRRTRAGRGQFSLGAARDEDRSCSLM